MTKLSTGQDSTLGNYYNLCKLIFGPNSKSAEFFLNKINDPTNVNDAAEIIIAPESQMMQLIYSLEL